MFLRSIAKRALPYFPAWLQRIVREKREQQRLTQHAARKIRTQVAIDDVVKRLKEMRLRRDLLVHGSISNIGKLDKPIKALVGELIGILDLTRQTLVVPALPYSTTMREYLGACKSFDVRTARNAMGAISNIVMTRPEALRSVHPTHSVVAVGADARGYTSSHHLDTTPFGQHSPYWRITQKRGQILMIGVGLNSVTCFHVYEDMLGDNLPFKVYLAESFDVPCLGAEGKALNVITRCHNPILSSVRDCERARLWLTTAGAIRSCKLGESELSLVDAYLFTKTLLERLKSGDSIYGKVSLTPSQSEAVNAALQRLESDT